MNRWRNLSKPLSAQLRKQLRMGLTSCGVLISRLGWLPANISPLGSWGFMAAKNNLGPTLVWYAVSILLFDTLWGGWYQGWWVTYLGFAGYPLFGWLARGSARARFLALPAASFWFFLVSNLGVWWYWYPTTFSGLAACYLAALPFYSRTLVGDLVFGWGYLAITQWQLSKMPVVAWSYFRSAWKLPQNGIIPASRP